MDKEILIAIIGAISLIVAYAIQAHSTILAAKINSGENEDKKDKNIVQQVESILVSKETKSKKGFTFFVFLCLIFVLSGIFYLKEQQNLYLNEQQTDKNKKEHKIKIEQQRSKISSSKEKLSEESLNVKDENPENWSEELWKECWNGKYIDFTEQVWIDLQNSEQSKLAKNYQLWYAKSNGLEVEKIIEIENEKIEMSLIPPGKYLIYRKFDYSNENKGKTTLIDKPFWCGKYEITQILFKRIMKKNPSQFINEKNPIENVTYDEAVEFCNKTRLEMISEAQWEYACRSGTTSDFYFGDTITQKQANFNRTSTVNVGTYACNSFGLYDMHGNVWEWCEDKLKNSRIYRGGGFYNNKEDCRSSSRFDSEPHLRYDFLGFRVIKNEF